MAHHHFSSQLFAQPTAKLQRPRERRVTLPSMKGSAPTLVKVDSRVNRRATMPTELEDLDDITVSERSTKVAFVHRSAATNIDHDSFAADHQSPTGLVNEVVQLPKEVRNLVAGGIAGMTAKSVVAPFDRIKILYQVSSARFALRHVPRVAVTIVQNEGFLALWRGNSATMIRVFPYSGIQFTVYDRCKTFFLREHLQGRYMLQHNSNNMNETGKRAKFGLTPIESLAAGMFAGTVSVICTYPLDLTRTQMALMKRHKLLVNKGFPSVLKDNYTQRGALGLFRGITPTILGILPYSGIAFALNEQGKREIQHLFNRDPTTIERMQCGAFAGLVAQTVTYPIEVCRRRMQTIGLVGNDTALDNLQIKKASFVAEPPTLLNTIRSLYHEQGVRGFYKGVTMNWIKGPITFSISFTVFDSVQALMESEGERALKLGRRFTRRRDD